MTIIANRTRDIKRGRWHCSTCLASALLVSLIGFAPQAQAQDANASGVAQTAQEPVAQGLADDIVVTAQFRAQRLQDTPLAITATNAEMLEARSQTSVTQIAAQSPNVALQPAPATFGPAMQAFIRGVGQAESNFSVEPGVGLYVDDVYYSTVLGSVLDLLDLDRVEILRGPQGTLAGQNSIGGAIKLYTRRPDGENGGYLQATYGRFNRLELRGAADFTLVPDHLSARISGTGVSRDGYVTRYDYGCTHPGSGVRSFQTGNSCKIGTEGGQSYIAGRLAVRWTPSDRLEINLAGDITRDGSEPAATTLLYVGGFAGPGVPANGNPAAYTIDGVPLGTAAGSAFISYTPMGDFARDTFSTSPFVSYENYLNWAPRDGSAPYAAPISSKIDSWGLSANARLDISDVLSLTSITAYREYTGEFSSAEGTPLTTNLIINRPRHQQFTQELRLNGKIGRLVDYTVGGFYLDSQSRNDSRVQIVSFEFLSVDEVPSQSTKAAFVNADVHLTDALDVSGGLRYTTIERSFAYQRSSAIGSVFGGLAPPAVRPLNGLQNALSDDRVDYRVALQYRWSPEIMTYASIATGFKSGGFNQRPSFAPQAIPHGAEKITAYEVGAKTDFLDRRVRVNVSGFVSKYDDIVMTVTNCPLFPGTPAAPCQLPLNAGTATLKGFELETTVRPINGLLIDASLAYLDFQYDSLAPLAQSAGIRLDMVGPFVQKLQYSVGAQYKFDVPGGTLTPRLDLNRRGSFYTNPVNADPFNRVAARTLLNGRVTYRHDDDWQLALEVTNLTNTLYYDSVFDNRGSGSYVAGRPGRPREWAVSVRRNF